MICPFLLHLIEFHGEIIVIYILHVNDQLQQKDKSLTSQILKKKKLKNNLENLCWIQVRGPVYLP